jgi:hypothetical protein
VNFATLAVACESDKASSVATREADKGAANCAAEVAVGESPTALRVEGTVRKFFGLTPEGTAQTAVTVAALEPAACEAKDERPGRARSVAAATSG